jgi:predicted phosphoribosyltransferase
VLARKLRAPDQPELALGAVDETGEVHLDRRSHSADRVASTYLESERRYQLREIERRRALFRAGRSPASLTGRSVILVDDGIATGSTMMAALCAVRARGAKDVVIAVPVGSPDRLSEVRPLADRVVCLDESDAFWAVGQAYIDFEQVPDERVVELLEDARQRSGAAKGPGRSTAGSPGNGEPT